MRKLVAAVLVAHAVCRQRAFLALGIIGGLFGGFIINEALQPRVYVQPRPYYRQEYIPPPVYYAPPPVYAPTPYCRFEYYRDSWGYVYSQKVCY